LGLWLFERKTAIKHQKHYFNQTKITMQTINLEVENIKCGGCMSSIKKSLLGMSGVLEVEIQQENGLINVIGNGNASQEKITRKLKSLGYPEKGTSAGLDGLLTEAKSFVSCAIGRMN
jgi:copper chaperone